MVIATEDKQQAGWQWQVFPGDGDYGALEEDTNSSGMIQEIKALFQEAEHRQEQRIGSLIQRVEHTQHHVLAAMFQSARSSQEEQWTKYREQQEQVLVQRMDSGQAAVERFLRGAEDRQQERLRELFSEWQRHILRQQEESDQRDEMHRLQQEVAYAQQLQVQRQLQELHTFHMAQAKEVARLRGQLDTINNWLTWLPTHTYHSYVAPAPVRVPVPEAPACQDCDQDGVVEVPDRGCMLRRIRLGLVSPREVEVVRTSQERRRRPRLAAPCNAVVCPKDEDGYLADDESSLCSDESEPESVASGSLWDERRELVLAVRRLQHVRPPPRYSYRPSWAPFRCYRCRRSGHVALLCDAKSTRPACTEV